MIKKLSLAVGFLCTANIAAAAIDIIPENAEIITENFKVVDEVPADSTYQINSVKSAHDNSEKLISQKRNKSIICKLTWRTLFLQQCRNKRMDLRTRR